MLVGLVGRIWDDFMILMRFSYGAAWACDVIGACAEHAKVKSARTSWRICWEKLPAQNQTGKAKSLMIPCRLQVGLCVEFWLRRFWHDLAYKGVPTCSNHQAVRGLESLSPGARRCGCKSRGWSDCRDSRPFLDCKKGTGALKWPPNLRWRPHYCSQNPKWKHEEFTVSKGFSCPTCARRSGWWLIMPALQPRVMQLRRKHCSQRTVFCHPWWSHWRNRSRYDWFHDVTWPAL